MYFIFDSELSWFKRGTSFYDFSNILFFSSSLRILILKSIMTVGNKDEPLGISSSHWLHMDLYSFS